ncbi:hypothetical protein LTR85_011095 [Meristemomyces frigidus]|nr:hypothetical protein LTR85_011095 [Meristemomyces frigidus]
MTPNNSITAESWSLVTSNTLPSELGAAEALLQLGVEARIDDSMLTTIAYGRSIHDLYIDQKNGYRITCNPMPIRTRQQRGLVAAKTIFNRFEVAGGLGERDLQPSSLAVTVFGIPELCERILLSLELTDLLYARVVSKTFYHTVAGSQMLLRSLFLLPRSPMEYWRIDLSDYFGTPFQDKPTTITKSQDVIYGNGDGYTYTRPVQLNSLIFDEITGYLDVKKHPSHSLSGSWDLWDKVVSGRGRSIVRMSSTSAINKFADVQLHHGCRQMLLTQPPATKCVVRYDFEDGHEAKLSVLVNETGLTLADLVDDCKSRFDDDAILMDWTQVYLVKYVLPDEEEWDTVESEGGYVGA